MSFVLLDWTRMGRGYCLAGAVLGGTAVQIVRPLSVRRQRAGGGPGGVISLIRSFFVRDLPPEGDRMVSWPAFLMAGRSRWEVFDLVSPRPATSHGPHLEDTWVRGLRPWHRLATPEQRRTILKATAAPTAEALFGAPLRFAGSRTFVLPGEGERSLSTLLAPVGQIRFRTGQRSQESKQTSIRVDLPLADLELRTLPVTDHHLLSWAEQQAPRAGDQVDALNGVVRQMGETVAVRLGLSRPFASEGKPPVCWLMANGFFSLAEPQP